MTDLPDRLLSAEVVAMALILRRLAALLPPAQREELWSRLNGDLDQTMAAAEAMTDPQRLVQAVEHAALVRRAAETILPPGYPAT